MPHDLEAPGTDDAPDWDSLYRARGDEVTGDRPVFTGDVFFGVSVAGATDTIGALVLQHPCAIRTDGVRLVPRLLVSEVRPSELLSPSRWIGGFYKQMPLPYLEPKQVNPHFKADFTTPYLVTPDELAAAERVACMAQFGVNLLLQRWVHHNSRVVVPTPEYQRMSASQFEEADLMEDWCLERSEDGKAVLEATEEIDTWLAAADSSGVSPRMRLADEQQRSHVRKEMRTYLRSLRADDGTS